ncbi:3-methyladenine DNA glycosylase [Kytococcus sedentarius]|uniref:3-methyladenine DNA glycosylase n=1 Tax=Kytococcus sedentarius TaxID=1276 RepID=UPI00194E4489|nr:3-methyladenine DNA glycosylase [Kytococcus sedentarius]QRO88041.1 3-methyladenine DNA glycosylase [Kytococcus sedentarius]
MPTSPAPLTVLDRETWSAREAAHHARVDAIADPHLERRRRGEKHPVEDFLWVYYRWRPAEIRRWHPGLGVALADADERAGWKDHLVVDADEVSPGKGGGHLVTVDVEAFLARRGDAVRRWHDILKATANRPARFGCFGLHEWAMVHGLEADDRRHGGVPLRLGREGTDAVTESHTIACSHFDAYRFFTDSSRGLNTLSPGPADRTEYEQPGCLHATMDLYKVAATLGPLAPGELLVDCLELARDVRELDMRASPYDLRDWGYEPVRIETPEGKAAYVAAQRGFSERGQALRARLVQVTSRALQVR